MWTGTGASTPPLRYATLSLYHAYFGRYRNFRTFTSPRPTQFLCLDVDQHGELICAGSQTEFEVYVWSMRTGRLLDVLAGKMSISKIDLLHVKVPSLVIIVYI